MKRKSMEEYFFKILMVVSIVIVLGGILSVIFTVVLKGVSALSISMLIESPHGGYYLGGGGGILNAILGSLYLAGGAIILAITLSLPVAMYLHQSTMKSRYAEYIRTSLDIACGIPTIIYGAVVF
jgi:phosphate transport system permease protein